MTTPKPEALGPVRYWTFKDQTTTDLADQIRRAGPGYALVVTPKEDRSCWLQVVPSGHTAVSAAASGFAPLDHSVICPPFCG